MAARRGAGNIGPCNRPAAGKPADANAPQASLSRWRESELLGLVIDGDDPRRPTTAAAGARSARELLACRFPQPRHQRRRGRSNEVDVQALSWLARSRPDALARRPGTARAASALLASFEMTGLQYAHTNRPERRYTSRTPAPMASWCRTRRARPAVIRGSGRRAARRSCATPARCCSARPSASTPLRIPRRTGSTGRRDSDRSRRVRVRRNRHAAARRPILFAGRQPATAARRHGALRRRRRERIPDRRRAATAPAARVSTSSATASPTASRPRRSCSRSAAGGRPSPAPR